MRNIHWATLVLLMAWGCAQATPEEANDTTGSDGTASEVTDLSDQAAETSQASPASQLPPADPLAADRLEVYKADPTNVQSLVDYANANLRQIIEYLDDSPDEAEKLIVGFRQSLEGLETPNEDAQAVYMQVQDSLDSMADRLPVIRMSLDEIRARVKANPNDAAAVKMLASKLEMMAFKAMDDDLDKAEKILLDEVKFIEGNAQKAEGNAAQIAYSQLAQTINQMADQISRSKQYRAVVGKEMIDLEAEAWVNGGPLSKEDLQGKVVLLDFWAVWCGPCLMSFPHLAEWQENYGDEGLQIVGLTRYYNFHWPEEAQAPEQSDNPVTPKDEQAMLERLVKQFELSHPTAILPNENEASEYYAEMGLPHLVLIGRDGKVRRVEAGISSQLAEELEQEIKTLLAEPAPDGAPETAKPSNGEAEKPASDESKPVEEEKSKSESEPAEMPEPDLEPQAEADTAAATETPPAEEKPGEAEPAEEAADVETAEQSEAVEEAAPVDSQ